MVTIKIMNEFPHGPVWTREEGTAILTDTLPLVHEDPLAASLNREIGELFDSYYEFDSHDQACWFNEEKERPISLACSSCWASPTPASQS